MERIAAHFDEGASSYHEQSVRPPWSWLRSREAAVVLRLLTPARGEAILDAGCGAGYYAELIQQTGAEVTALDLSASMLRQVKERLGLETIEANLASVELEPRFDAILCAGAFEFLTRGEAAGALLRLTKGVRKRPDSGPPPRIVLLLPRLSLAGRIYRRFHRRHGIEVSLFDRAWIEHAATETGWHVVAVKRVTLNWAVRLERP